MISIYKPNKKNEGCACSFYMGRDGNIYMNSIQQFSWNEEKRTGSFSENAKNKDKSISVKINEFEAGGIISAIDHFGEFSAFHSYEDNKTQISFKAWEKNDDKKTKAFGLSITRNTTDKFKLPIEQGEAQVIKYFLIDCINKKSLANEQKKSPDTQQ